MSNKYNAEIALWRRFNTNNLQIVSSIAGDIFEFEFCGFTIKVIIPKKPRKKDEENWEKEIYCTQWRGDKPYGYRINEIDLHLYTKRKRSVPKNPKKNLDMSLYNDKQRKSLKNFVNKYNNVLEDAFQHLVEVLRWKTKNLNICNYLNMLPKSNWAPELIDAHTNKRLFHPGFHLQASFGYYITKREWNLTKKALNEYKEIPVWRVYLAEASNHLEIGQIKKTIVALAISIESLVRFMTSDLLSDKANSEYKKLVDRSTSIIQIISKWKKFGFTQKNWEEIDIAKIKKIFEKRNGIMHRGEEPNMSKKGCQQLLKVTIDFINAGELEIIKSNKTN